MDLFLVLGWIFYGIIIGLIAKYFYRGDVPVGFIPTIAVGVLGSFLGGFIKYVLTGNGTSFQPSGIALSIIGGILFCYIYTQIKKNSWSKIT